MEVKKEIKWMEEEEEKIRKQIWLEVRKGAKMEVRKKIWNEERMEKEKEVRK